MKNEELENRLIEFTVAVSKISASLKRSELSQILSQQLIRSTTSAALNYSESRGAESKKDFIHKVRLTLKELRESHTSLRILQRADSTILKKDLDSAVNECNQLISIFVVSIRTAESKQVEAL